VDTTQNHTKSINNELLSAIPEKKTVYDDLKENLESMKLPPIPLSSKSPSSKHKISIQNPQRDQMSHSINIERLFTPHKKEKRPSIEFDYSKSSQQTPKSAFSEMNMLKTDKQMKENINSANNFKFCSFSDGNSLKNVPLKGEISIFSPKREGTSKFYVKNSANEKIESSNDIQSLKNSVTKDSSRIKFMSNLSKYYKDSPKEAYQRIYEKAMKEENSESQDKKLKVESMRNGKVILCKKKDVIMRNNTAVKILSNHKNNFFDQDVQKFETGQE